MAIRSNFFIPTMRSSFALDQEQSGNIPADSQKGSRLAFEYMIGKF